MTTSEFIKIFGPSAVSGLIVGLIVAILNFYFTRWHDERRAVFQSDLERQKTRDAIRSELLRRSIDAYARIFAALHEFEDARDNTIAHNDNEGRTDMDQLRAAAKKLNVFMDQLARDRFFFSSEFSDTANAYMRKATAALDDLSVHNGVSQAQKDAMLSMRQQLLRLAPNLPSLVKETAPDSK